MLLVVALLAQQVVVQNFPPIDHPGADPLYAADIRAVCSSKVASDRIALYKVEEEQALHVTRAKDPGAWLGLSCTRALLSGLGALSHESTLMIAGDSWAQGAVKALLQVMALRPGDRAGAELLAMLAMQDEEPRDLNDAVSALDRAVRLGATEGATLRGCADLALRAHRPEITQRCATRALAVGKDSTWHLLLLSRLRFRDADSVGGSEQFVRAAGAAHDTVTKLDIAWHLQWFVSPDERKEWATLPDHGRDLWMRDHLISRDVRDGQPAGARLAEHFKRLEYVENAFRLRVPKMLHTAMLSKPSSGILPPGPPMTPNGFATPMTSQGGPPGPSILFDNSFRDYVRWQVEWDDRGVIWMRYGEPRLRFFFQGPEEIWRYDIDGHELLLTFVGEDFDGSSGATRLLTGRISDHYCGIDEWRCALSMRMSVPPEIMAAVKQQDREYISAGTTKDDNSIRTEDVIDLTSRLHRLWDPVSGTSLALLTWSVKANDVVTAQDSGQRTTRVEFAFRRWDASENRWQDTTFSRRFNFADNGVRRLTGFLVTPSSPDVSSWSLIASQSDKRRGRAWDVTTPPLDHGAVALSDLVLGQEGQGVAWNIHNVEVLLAPLNGVDRKQPVSLYYQVRAMAPQSTLHTTVALYRIEGGMARDTAALQLGFEQSLRAGINEVAPMLDVSRLEHGSYRLEVRLTDERGVVVSRRSVELNLD